MQKEYELHIKKYSKAHEARVIDKLLEEMAELQVELMKRRNKDKSSRLEILSEIVDVKICLEFLIGDLAMGLDDEKKLHAFKVKKLRKQLNESF